MDHLFGLIVLLLFVVGILKLLENVTRNRHPGISYDRLDNLFSPAERLFFDLLDQILANKYRVFAKVRLGDILRVRKGLSNPAWASAFNRICRKHVDFVLCDPRTFEIAGVIELDDSSHDWASSRKRDEVKNAALEAAGISVVRIRAQRSYDPADVQSKISEVFSRRQNSNLVP